MPAESETRREWLETLRTNSHCLAGCEKLCIRYRRGTLTPEVKGLIVKFKPLVQSLIMEWWDEEELAVPDSGGFGRARRRWAR